MRTIAHELALTKNQILNGSTPKKRGPGPTARCGGGWARPTLVQYSNVLHWHGCQDPVIEFLDERLAKAFSHRLRLRILERLSEHGVGSPSELADALGAPLGNVSYHVRILRELDCLELVRTQPHRGALEHFYRATVCPWLDDEQWAQLPAAFRRKTLVLTLSETREAAAQAARRGGFDGPETHVSHVALAVDQTGRTEIAALLAETRAAALRIHAASAGRQAERGPEAPPSIATELALIHLRHADANQALDLDYRS
jgi:DNA-binding transcriptional ArsR family regulator